MVCELWLAFARLLVCIQASSHPVITSRKTTCFRHSCYASSRHSQIAVDDSRDFRIAQCICKCVALNGLQSLLLLVASQRPSSSSSLAGPSSRSYSSSSDAPFRYLYAL